MKSLFAFVAVIVFLASCVLAQDLQSTEPTTCVRVRRRIILYSCTDGNNIGSECVIRCRAGFRRIGERRTTCTPSGFSPSIADNNCVRENRTCNRIKRRKMQYECSDGNRRGSVCRLSCKDGYYLLGNTRIDCTKNGFIPSAENNECVENGTLPTAPVSTTPCARVSDHRLTYDCTNESEVGSSCEISCRPGYQLVGASSTICTENGFNPSITDNHCIRETRLCDRIEISNMLYLCSDENRRASVCRLRCESGYRLHGVTKTECKKSGFTPSPQSNQCV